MKKINFTITTPIGTIYKSDALSVTIDTLDGQLTILPEHTPIIVPINAGEVLVKNKQNEEISLAIHGGFLEVLKGSKVNILADGAIHEDEIDEEEVKEAIKRAEELKKQKLDKSSIEYAKVSARLERELAKLRIVRKKRRR